MANKTQDFETREMVFNGLADGFYGLSIASVIGSLALMVRAQNFGGEDRASFERQAIFVGLWPPTFAIFGKIFADQTSRPELPFAPRREAMTGAGGRLVETH